MYFPFDNFYCIFHLKLSYFVIDFMYYKKALPSAHTARQPPLAGTAPQRAMLAHSRSKAFELCSSILIRSLRTLNTS